MSAHSTVVVHIDKLASDSPLSRSASAIKRSVPDTEAGDLGAVAMVEDDV